MRNPPFTISNSAIKTSWVFLPSEKTTYYSVFLPVCKPASLCAVSRGTGTLRMGILICSTRTHTHTHTDKSLHLMLYLSGKCWPEAPLLQNTVQHKHKATYDWIEGILSCELNQKTESSRVKRKPTEETLKNSF